GPGAADDRITTYEYDASGEHLIRVTVPGGEPVSYSYITGESGPREHSLVEVTYADGTHDSFTYDSRGRLTSTSKQGEQQTTFAYDDSGGVRVTDANGRTTSLFYGLGRQLAQIRDPDGRIVNLRYDTARQLIQLIGSGGEKYNYTYDANTNL